MSVASRSLGVVHRAVMSAEAGHSIDLQQRFKEGGPRRVAKGVGIIAARALPIPYSKVYRGLTEAIFNQQVIGEGGSALVFASPGGDKVKKLYTGKSSYLDRIETKIADDLAAITELDEGILPETHLEGLVEGFSNVPGPFVLLEQEMIEGEDLFSTQGQVGEEVRAAAARVVELDGQLRTEFGRVLDISGPRNLIIGSSGLKLVDTILTDLRPGSAEPAMLEHTTRRHDASLSLLRNIAV